MGLVVALITIRYESEHCLLGNEGAVFSHCYPNSSSILAALKIRNYGG
jgi:hypothetical protein